MWIEFVRHDRETTRARDEILKPVLLELLGPLEAKKVLDAGCGEGDNSRTMAGHGASVTAVDVSDALLDAAKKEEQQTRLGITYLQRDITDLGDLADFDAVLANQVISVVQDHGSAFRELSRVLRPGGVLIASVTHPGFDGVGPGWVRESDGEVRWYSNRYLARVDGLAAHGAPTYHRPLSDYVTTAIASGFVLTGLREPVAGLDYSRRQPAWARPNDVIPTLAVLRLVKQ
jgi:SAM-dependent methyltransferase